MTKDELQRAINLKGFRFGYDTGTGEGLIISKGYQLLGRIDPEKQFCVNLNKHFERLIDEEVKTEIYDAIIEFVKTPIEDRKAGAAHEQN